MKYSAALLTVLVIAPHATALHIRDYTPAAHDRFTGFPGTPAVNPGFLHGPAGFTGVGWSAAEAHKQFALVSPLHFVCAGHAGAPPAVGHYLRFVGADGTLVQRAVAALTPVPADTTGNSDVVVGTLASAVPAGVEPLPYLNLPGELDYVGKELMVFGHTAKAGKGAVRAFEDLDFDGGGPNGSTRVFTFEYMDVGSGPDDCYLEGGDSGSPSFVSFGGRPALVGLHGAVIPPVAVKLNVDSFLPRYAAGLDAVLAPQGYRMRPAVFTPTTLGFSSSAPPGILKSGLAGSVDFTIVNTGGHTAGNLSVTLRFAPGAAPSGIAAGDGVAESVSPGVWSVRKAVVAASEQVVITASWTAVPDAFALAAIVSVESDTAPAATYPLEVPVAQTYDSWSEGLGQAGKDDDPDGDGWVNLLEYAFGSPGDSGTFAMPGENGMRPAMEIRDGIVSLSFPERVHAGTLGLTYLVEVSGDLGAGSWSPVLPEGSGSTTGPISPAVPGFLRRTFTWPADGSRGFARVRASLGPPP